MPRVLLLCEYPSLNGGERSMLATLDGLRAAGFWIAAAAPPEGPLAEALVTQGIDVIAFRTRDDRGGRRPLPQLREELARLLARLRPDLLHANSLAMGRLSGPVAVGAELPSIAHLRDILRLSCQAVEDLNCHTRLLAVSQAVRQFHVGCGLDAAKTHVLYNGVELERSSPRPATGYLHRELGLAPQTALVGSIGQIGQRKGQDVLLRAAALLAHDLPSVHYLIVGQRWSDKAEAQQFEADLHAAAGHLAGRVHFLGVRNDVHCILSELTLLVHPARQEPLGRVLLEAAASGTPIVATDVGGTREIFPADCQAARLVPPDNPSALAGAMEELLGDQPLCARLGLAARRRAAEAFDATQAAAGLAEHYRQVLTAAPARGA